MKNENKYALVTGGAGGIGYELSKLLALDGYNLILVARNEDELFNAATGLTNYGVSVTTIQKDLFERNHAFDLYHEIKSQGIEIDILINNAGHGHYGEFIDTNLDMELKIIDLNIGSLVILTKLFLKDMVERKQGRILNLSSIASKSPGPWQSVYHGTKAFVQSFTEAIRSEVKDSGVTLTALLPGATATDFFNKAGMQDSKVVQEGKLYDPVDVAKDGYEALMKGEDMVVSGFMNKVNVAMSNLTSDEKLADKMKKQQEPVSSEKK
ncbi:MAG TPA: SDR family oxidoreductase [Ohtaekwangia sp.]